MNYHSRDYRIELNKLSEEDGGGYIAYIPELNCHGDGDTPEEAMSDAYEVADEILSLASEDGIFIPPPKEYRAANDYSGKFTVRIPKELHRKLTEEAEADGCSLNTLVASYLSYGLGRDAISISLPFPTQKRVSFDRQQILNANVNIWREGSPSEALTKFFTPNLKRGACYVSK